MDFQQVQLVESIDRQSMKAVLPRPDRIFRQHPQQLAGAPSPSGGSSMGSSDVPVPSSASSGAWWRRSGDPLALAAPGGAQVESFGRCTCAPVGLYFRYPLGFAVCTPHTEPGTCNHTAPIRLL